MRRGIREGFDRCAKDLAQRAYDNGYAQGVQAGQSQGTQDGQVAGQKDGDRDGRAAGATDGENRADSDANAAATPAGTQQGISDANASDASAKGQADGAVAGDQAALADAKKVDYERGREAYRNDQFNSPVQSNDTFSQKPQQLLIPSAPQQSVQGANSLMASAPAKKAGFLARLGSSFKELFSRHASPSAPAAVAMRFDGGDGHDGQGVTPDFRYYNPTKTYPTAAETTAYQAGYRQGYISGFNQAYGQAFQQTFPRGMEQGRIRGCRQAHMQNYDADGQRGFNDGRQKGYADAFHQAHDIAYKTAYNYAFQAASQAAYQANYQNDYNTHFAAARAAAYQQQYNQVYQSAFDAAKQQKYNEVYPKYAAEQYKLGQQDEAQDFQLRPVRLLDAQLTETIPNGVMEPGEALRVKLTLRNFSNQTIAAKNVKLMIQAQDTDGTVVSIPSEILVQNLKPKSVTTVTDALEVRLDESAVGQSKTFVVSALYEDRDCGDVNVSATAEFMMGTGLAAQPVLQEGLKGQIQIRVTNNSQVASDAGAVVTLKSDPNVLEVDQGQQTIGSLQPGESTVVSFPVIPRADGSEVNLPLAVSVTLPNGRRVGLMDTTDQVPLSNDYVIGLNTSTDSLRQNGITRLDYTITNQGSRLMYKGLQLKVSVIGPNASNFQVLGPNPQYLTPVEQGKSVDFVVPVLSNAQNSGGTLQLEVEEDGRTVVIHRVNF